jgi:polyvinyl alcohol dehydrogenase (cytochrome)
MGAVVGQPLPHGRRKAARVVAAVIGAGFLGAGTIGGGMAAGGGVASAAAAKPMVREIAKTQPPGAGQQRARAAATLPATDWPAYLNGPLHTSYNGSQTAITPANAAALTPQWSFTTGAPYVASPTVTSNAVYIGSAQGVFYKLSEHTGKVLNQINIGSQPALTCGAAGVSSTAAVGFSPRGHIPTVYVAGGDGDLYALRASNLSVEWKAVVAIPSATVNNYYNWSSPTVAHGKIYLGISSSCDVPLIRGGVVAFSQATGRRLAVYYTVPSRAKNAGGSVWSSIGVAPNGDVYATTGNGPADAPRLQNSESILKLDPNTLRPLDAYKVPERQVTGDGDFGGSPVFFGNYVGACNKNGYFYVLNQVTMKLVWRWRIGYSSGGPKRGECLASPAYNGRDLFFGGNETTFDKVTTPGSVIARSAKTGALLWQTALPSGVMGSPALDGGGLLAVGTYSPAPDGVYLLNASTGAIVEQLTPGWTFAQSVFANSWLYTATSNGVTVWGLPAPPP